MVVQSKPYVEHRRVFNIMANNKTEANEIRRDGGTPQPNSGRGTHKKGDGLLGPFLFDVKEYSEGFRVTRKNWAKACTDAFRVKQSVPAFKLVLGEKDKVRLWVVDDSMFHEMLAAWEEKNG